MKYKDGVYTHSTMEEGYDFYITDRFKKKYHFKIASFLLGDLLASEAIEIVAGKKGREPYIFNKLFKFDVDEEYVEMLDPYQSFNFKFEIFDPSDDIPD